MENSQIAKIFEEIGELLEIDGANRFRVIAYQNAAEIIKGYGREMREIFDQDPDQLEEIPGIGHDLRAKIEELLKTGHCQFHQELVKKYGHGVIDILGIRGLGPKKVKLFYTELGIDNLAKLEKAARAGRLAKLPRMGEKSQAEILKALDEKSQLGRRLLLNEALPIAEEIVGYLKKFPAVLAVEYAGSLRRGKETIGDLDILATPKKTAQTASIIDHFQKFQRVSNVVAGGPTKSSVILDNGVQVDLRVVDQKSWGAALHYFTGSKEHNIAIRDLAKKQGLKVNEYGVFKGVRAVAGRTEEEIYAYFNLLFIPPTLRENRGEFAAAAGDSRRAANIVAAATHKLPKLIELKDLKGSLHNHSLWTDGLSTIEEMALAHLKAGMQYMAITDHSKGLGIANGLDEKKFIQQWKEVDALNKKLAGKFRILKGVECDIRSNGEMDFENSFLKKFELVIGSVHSNFQLSEPQQTERICKAIANPYVHILGHPTGRLLNTRPAYAVNLEKVISTAAQYHKIIEINGQPPRLDLPDNYIIVAKEKGLKFAINSDAHHTNQISYLRFATLTAQRGWCEKSDIVNTLPLKSFLKLITNYFLLA